MRRLMTISALVLAFGLAAGTASTQETYTIDPNHSNVAFKVRHLVSKVGGEFTDFEGTIMADFSNLDACGVQFSIKSASIDTRNEKRDGHLRSADFFDVERYPTITFSSTKITKIDDSTYAVAGILTMRGVSKPVTLTVDYLGSMTAMGGTRAGYELSTTLNRKEWGISWNRALDTGGFILGDEVDVIIDLEVVKETGEK